jgi:hypothetical protein
MKLYEQHKHLSLRNAWNLITTPKGISLQIVNSKPEKKKYTVFGDSPSLHLVNEVSIPGMTSLCCNDSLTTSSHSVNKHPDVSNRKVVSLVHEGVSELCQSRWLCFTAWKGNIQHVLYILNWVQVRWAGWLVHTNNCLLLNVLLHHPGAIRKSVIIR